MMETVMKEVKVIDIEGGINLLDGRRDLAWEVLTLLIKRLPSEREQLQEAVDKEDTERIKELMHRFYGGLCYVGAPRLREVVRQLEFLIESGELVLEDILEHCQLVFKEMDAVERAWKQLSSQEEIEER